MTSYSVLKAALFATTAALAGSSAAAAAPQSESALAADYNLPAQDLASTLKAIARASGADILFAAEAVRGLKAPDLKGRLTLGEALAKALSGSNLVVDYRAGAALVHERNARSSPATSASAPAAITITGTRLRGVGSTSPVSVTSRRELEQAGVSNLAEFTRVLTQNFTGGQNPGVAGGGSQGGQTNLNNSAALNLRGLGPDATLTLINGHRVAYDALGQGIDIAAIPLSAVDRIEVVADGASALYGSDAVGGVANIILRRDFDGAEFSVRAGASTDGGNVQQEYSGISGLRWRSGGFMLALDHSRATPIYADQRSYTRTLDPSLTLSLKNAQTSAVLAGHQQIAPGLNLEFDSYLTTRRSRKQSPFLPDEDVHVFGLTTAPSLRSYALAPTLRAELPGDWQGTLSATRGVSRTKVDTAQWFGSDPFRSRLIYANSLMGGEGIVEGPLFMLPGGSVRMVAGGGYRRLKLHVNISDFIGGSLVPYQVYTERRGVSFAYGELSLPLIGADQRVPLVRRLALTAALRHEHWKGIDKASTPKLGLIYEPSADATLRATWGRSFKVPTLFQVNQAPQGVLFPADFFDPQPVPPLPAGSTVLLLGGGNRNLKAERATTWSASLELHPRSIHGLNVRGTWFDVDFRNRITSPISGVLSALPNPVYRDLIVFSPTIEQVSAIVAGLPQGLSNQTGEPFDPASVAAIVDTALRNTAREHVRGLDLDARYPLRLGQARQLIFSGSASYLLGDLQVTANQPIMQRAGTIFNPPRWRGRASLSFQSARFDLLGAFNYLGSVRDTRFPDKRRVGAFVTLDASAAFRPPATADALENVELRLTVLNLLNEKPDIIRNSQPEAPSYDSTNQSAVGRFVGATLRKRF